MGNLTVSFIISVFFLCDNKLNNFDGCAQIYRFRRHNFPFWAYVLKGG